MSFEIQLMRNLSDPNVVDKNITVLQSVTGTLRAQCSVINPNIMFEGVTENIIAQCNYMYIPIFHRYYKDVEITLITDTLYQITAHVDVLKSAAAELRNCTAIISKQQQKWNLYLNDGSIKTYQNPHIITQEFPDYFSRENNSLLLTVAG